MRLNDFFDRIVYLNLKSRPDRDDRMKRELRKWNIIADRFEAIPNAEAQASYNLSTVAILSAFLESESRRLLLLEDDVIFTNELLNISRPLTELSKMETSLIYLGGNLFDFPFEHYSRNLVRVYNVWTTHALAYTREVARMILADFDPLGPFIYDDYLAKQFLPKLFPPAYMLNPIVAIQEAGFSDLMKSPVDYTVCWNITRNRMRTRQPKTKIGRR